MTITNTATTSAIPSVVASVARQRTRRLRKLYRMGMAMLKNECYAQRSTLATGGDALGEFDTVLDRPLHETQALDRAARFAGQRDHQTASDECCHVPGKNGVGREFHALG